MQLQFANAKHIIVILLVGLIISALTVNIAISLAALIFSGPLTSYANVGVSMALVTAVIANATIALLSSYPGSVAIPQDRIAPILAVMATGIAVNMARTPDEVMIVTVVAGIIVATLITSFVLLVLGLTSLGEITKYIPYPVIGGFLAGTGWLLIVGSIRVTTGLIPSLDHLPLLVQSQVLLQWLPSLVVAIAMLAALRIGRNPLALPVVLLGASALFYAILWLIGLSLTEAWEMGLLLAPFPDGVLWQPVSVALLAQADWSAIRSQAGVIASAVLISAASVPLATSALAVMADEDLVQSGELRATGVANLLGGLAGGMISFHSLTLSSLPKELNVRSRWVGLISAVICLIILLAGGRALSYLPVPIMGGLLAFMGLSLLMTWLWDARRRLSTSDYAQVVLILVTVAAFGYLTGVAVGILVAAILFVINYSRLNVVKHIFNGSTRHSNVERPLRHYRLLASLGVQILILELQNFIFFGTISSVVDQVKTRLANESSQPLRFVILDFRAVTGVDSSAVVGLTRLRQLADRSKFLLLLTNLTPALQRQFLMHGLATTTDMICLTFPDLDHALEWCENRILHDVATTENTVAIETLLAEVFADTRLSELMMGYLQQRDLQAGEYLFRQGDAADTLFFVESGRVSVYLEGDERLRLRSMGVGTIVGELGLYSGGIRSASVVADQPTTVYAMTAVALNRMERDYPAQAAAFHRQMVQIVAERLINTNQAFRDAVG